MDHLASDYLLLSGPLLHIGLIITSCSDNRDIIVPASEILFCVQAPISSLLTKPQYITRFKVKSILSVGAALQNKLGMVK